MLMSVFSTLARAALRLLTACVVASPLLLATAAPAADLDQARGAGMVGERPDGLVGAVSATVTPDIKALIDMVNRERLATYRELAKKEALAPEAVQKVAGDRQVTKARANGWYWMDAAGAWHKG